MDRKEILNRVSDVIKEITLGKVTAVKPEDELFVDIGIDSMGAVELAFKFEDEFNIQVSDDELNEVKTIADIVDLVIKKTS